MATYRDVTADWGTLTGDPSVGQTVRYELDRSSFTADLIIDHGHTDDTIGADGTTSTTLWANLEGLVPSRYRVTFPKGDQYTFLLPAGDDPVSLMALLQEQGIPWQPPMLQDFIDAAIEVVYDSLANTTDLALGDAMVGTRHTATGATARTAHDKLDDWMTVRDFGAVGDGITDDSAAFALGIATAVAANRPLFIPTGTYQIDAWTPTTIAAPLTIIGEGRDVVTISGPGVTSSDPNFLETIHDLTLERVTLSNWNIAVNVPIGEAIAHDRFIMRDVCVRACRQGLYAYTIDTSGPANVDLWDIDAIVEWVELTDCEFVDLTGSAVVWQLGFRGFAATRVHVNGAYSRGLQIGRNFSTKENEVTGDPPDWTTEQVIENQEAFTALRVTGCVIEGMRNDPSIASP